MTPVYLLDGLKISASVYLHRSLSWMNLIVLNTYLGDPNKCEQVIALKNRAYERMQQRSCTQNSVEEYHVARREEKRVQKKKKWKYNEDKLQDLEHLSSINGSRTFYQELNKSCKDFKPIITHCRDKKDAIVSGKEMVLERF
jgi:hypothetical protein